MANKHTVEDSAQDDGGLTGTTRTAALSDGVFAITITLLVLEIHRPEYRPDGLLDALLKNWPSYLAYAVSFLYIGVLWLNHHSMFSRLRRMDLGFRWMNLGILFTTAILPFPTAVLASALTPGNSPYDQKVAVTFYALAAAAMSASWLPVFPYLRDHPELLKQTATAEYFRTQRLRPVIGVALYGLAVLVVWLVGPAAGLSFFVIMIIFHAVTSEGLQEGPLGRLLRLRRARRLDPARGRVSGCRLGL
jgi:uncharacterized membrane protein